MIHGMHPSFGRHMHDGMFRTPTAPHVRRAPAPEPHLTTSTRPDSYVIEVAAPAGFTIAKPKATSEAERALAVSGSLIQSADAIREYVTVSRSGVYEEPVASSLVSVIPAGRRLRGSAPSSDGWIALADDDDAFVLDDGSLQRVSAAPSPTPFTRRVELPADADVERGTISADGHGVTVCVPRARARPTTFRIVHSPGVYVRADPSLRARAIGYKHCGELVACAREATSEVGGWLKLADEDGWMLRDGRAVGLGPLLQPVESGPRPAAPRRASAAAAAPADSRRPMASPRTADVKPAVPRATAAAKPAAAPANKAATPAHARRAPEPSSAGKKQKAAAGAPAGGAPAGGARAGAGSRAGLYSEEPLLREVEASTANVQSPTEHGHAEQWVAIDDGSFALMATA